MNYIKSLKIIYTLQMIGGLIITLWGTFFLSIMSTDSPASTEGTAVMTGIVTFIVLLSIGVLLPISAVRELDRYPRHRRMVWNLVDTLPLALFFLPLALWQLYALWKIRQMSTEEVTAALSKGKDPESRREIEPVEENFDSAAYAERRLRELSRELNDADRK